MTLLCLTQPFDKQKEQGTRRKPSAMATSKQTRRRLTPHTANGVMVLLAVALGWVPFQGCALTSPPEAIVVMERDQVVSTLVDAWAPDGWAVVSETPYAVTFERMPTADEAFQVGNKPLRIVVTMNGRVVRARCYIGNQDASRGRWARQVQADFNRLLQ